MFSRRVKHKSRPERWCKVPDRSVLMTIFIPILIGALATTGLTAPIATSTTTVSVTILGAASLSVKSDGGSYDFGGFPGFAPPNLTRTITLIAKCNLPSYVVQVQATDVQLDLTPTTEIGLANLSYTGPNLTTSGTLTTFPVTIINNGTKTTSREHPVTLRLSGLNGGETAGNYTTVVTYTMITP